MELLKNIITDFCLFSLIEGFIYCYFFHVFDKIRKFKLKEIIILSIGNCLISQIFPPIIYQIFMILWMSTFLNYVRKIKYKECLKMSFYVMIFQLVTEMPIAMIYEIILKLENSLNLNKINIFINTIPMRIIQIISIYYYKRRSTQQ